MGCYSVSCALSGRAMYSDDAVLIPLAPERYQRKNNGMFHVSGSNLVSNDGTKLFFEPITLPVYGSIDSYGRLDDIVEDANTKAIEKFFKMKIDKFMEGIAYEGFADTEFPILKHSAGMFVHMDIYEELSTTAINDDGKDITSALNSSYLIDETLKVMGFNYIGKVKPELKIDKSEELWDSEKKLPFEEKRRYCHKWVHPLIPEIILWTDKRWGRLQIPNGKYNESVYGPGKLMKAIEEATGKPFPQEFADKISSKSDFDLRFEAALQELEEAEKGEKIWQEARNSNKELRDYAPRLSPEYMSLGVSREAKSILNLGTYNDTDGLIHFLNIYKDVLTKVKQQVIKFKTFEFNMTGCNKFYFPTACHYQMGNLYAERVLNNATKKLLDKEEAEIEKVRKEEEKWEKKYAEDEAKKKKKKASE